METCASCGKPIEGAIKTLTLKHNAGKMHFHEDMDKCAETKPSKVVRL